MDAARFLLFSGYGGPAVVTSLLQLGREDVMNDWRATYEEGISPPSLKCFVLVASPFVGERVVSPAFNRSGAVIHQRDKKAPADKEWRGGADGAPLRGTETRFDGGEQRASTGVGGEDR
jgi:hypothetical protein